MYHRVFNSFGPLSGHGQLRFIDIDTCLFRGEEGCIKYTL